MIDPGLPQGLLRRVTGGKEHDLVTLTSATDGGDANPDVTLMRFINADVDTDTDDSCTDLSVVLWMYNEL